MAEIEIWKRQLFQLSISSIELKKCKKIIKKLKLKNKTIKIDVRDNGCNGAIPRI